MISVIIPVYNTANKLKRCVDSILCQTFQDYEIILIDDGSTDESGQICDQYALASTKVYVRHKENGGVSSARNIGIDISKGEYICFVDSDDYVDNNYLNDMYSILVEKSADIVFCRLNKRNDKLAEILDFNNCNEIIQFVLKESSEMCTKMFKKKIIGDLRFNQSIFLGEDTLFAVEYSKKCIRGIFINQVLYHYEKSTSSSTYMTDSKLLNKYLTYIESRKQMLIDTSLIDDATKKMIIGSLYQSILDSYYQARFFKDAEAQINLCDEMREVLKMFPIPFKEQDKPYSFYVMAYFPRFFPIWNAISTRI